MAYLKAKAGAADSKAIHSAGGGAAASGASSPHVGREKNKSVNSARNKQMQAYDPAYAGKQVAAQGYNQPAGVAHNPAAQDQPQRYPAPDQYLQPNQYRQHPDAGYQQYLARNDRYDDGNSAMEQAGYPRYAPRAPEGALASRLEPWQLPAHDVRNKLDRIKMSEILEEQGPPGPACFAARIRREPLVPHFQQIGRASCRERV